METEITCPTSSSEIHLAKEKSNNINCTTNNYVQFKHHSIPHLHIIWILNS